MDGDGRGGEATSPGRVAIVLRWSAAVLLAASLCPPFWFFWSPNFWRTTDAGMVETSAIATLRNLVSCQKQFAARRAVDVDGDGIGEFGTIGELTGAAGLRADGEASRRGEPMRPPVLSPSLASISATGRVTKAGYRYRILLPATGGGTVGERGPTAPAVGNVQQVDGRLVASTPSAPMWPPFLPAIDTDAAERDWFASACPAKLTEYARRAFLVTSAGDVFQCANKDGSFWGERTPGIDSLPAGWRWGDLLPETFTGRDGTEWRRTR